MIHRLDYEQIRSQAAQGSISARFMLDTEAFSVFSGEYPFTNPPSTPEPADDSAPGKNAADDGTVDNDTDLLGLLTDKGDAHEPRRPAPREPARGPFSFAALPTADKLPACPRLCIPEPPDRRYRGCTIVPSICLPDTFRLAQKTPRTAYTCRDPRRTGLGSDGACASLQCRGLGPRKATRPADSCPADASASAGASRLPSRRFGPARSTASLRTAGRTHPCTGERPRSPAPRLDLRGPVHFMPMDSQPRPQSLRGWPRPATAALPPRPGPRAGGAAQSHCPLYA